MSLLTAKVTKTAAVGRQRTPPDKVPYCRFGVALPCANPHTPRRLVCADGATIHISYKEMPASPFTSWKYP